MQPTLRGGLAIDTSPLTYPEHQGIKPLAQKEQHPRPYEICVVPYVGVEVHGQVLKSENPDIIREHTAMTQGHQRSKAPRTITCTGGTSKHYHPPVIPGGRNHRLALNIKPSHQYQQPSTKMRPKTKRLNLPLCL